MYVPSTPVSVRASPERVTTPGATTTHYPEDDILDMQDVMQDGSEVPRAPEQPNMQPNMPSQLMDAVPRSPARKGPAIAPFRAR